MAETIEHRIESLIEAKIPIISSEGIRNTEANCPIPETYPSMDNRYATQLLGYFKNRGAEYILGISKWKADDDIDRKETELTIKAAFRYGKTINLPDKFEMGQFKMEVHAIIDPLQNKTHYFLLPHRKYFR